MVIGYDTAVAISDDLAIGGIIALSLLRGFALRRVFERHQEVSSTPVT